MRLKKGAKFLLSYNMKIVGGREEGGGMKLWWGIKIWWREGGVYWG